MHPPAVHSEQKLHSDYWEISDRDISLGVLGHGQPSRSPQERIPTSREIGDSRKTYKLLKAFQATHQKRKYNTQRMGHTQVVCWIQLLWAFPACTGRLSCVGKVRPKSSWEMGDALGASSQQLCPGEQSPGTLQPGLGWGGGGDKAQKLEMMPSLILGNHIPGGRGHLSHPALSQTKTLGQSSKWTNYLGLSSAQKLHLEKETWKDFTVVSVDQTKECITAQTIHLWKNTTSLFQFV